MFDTYRRRKSRHVLESIGLCGLGVYFCPWLSRYCFPAWWRSGVELCLGQRMVFFNGFQTRIPLVLWQRDKFHLSQSLLTYIPLTLFPSPYPPAFLSTGVRAVIIKSKISKRLQLDTSNKVLSIISILVMYIVMYIVSVPTTALAHSSQVMYFAMLFRYTLRGYNPSQRKHPS
ncbi:hypothetical protein F5Y17DRAFT_170080 [Xylariaceae sp. FL0594]|nr:hypothetical protein F5Y17DRAFT_170080 [Xylariaceae sp. FL0594]